MITPVAVWMGPACENNVTVTVMPLVGMVACFPRNAEVNRRPWQLGLVWVYSFVTQKCKIETPDKGPHESY